MAVTDHFDLPLPDETRNVDDEFRQLIITLQMIDVILKSIRDAALAAAPEGHGHQLGDIAGLVDALASKMPTNAAFALDNLTDVSGAAAAPNGHVLAKLAGVWSPVSAAAAIGNHQHAMGDIAGLAAALAEKLGLTGGTLSGTLRLATALFARAAAAGEQARVDFERSDGTVSGRLWHVGGANNIVLDLHSADGSTVLTRIEMSGNTPGTVTIGGSPVITSANTQSYLLLPSYVSGMAVSYVNATTCGVATGQARIGATPVEVAAAMTKRLDAVWAPGSGNGGLDTGVVQPNQTYHLRVIRNATTGVADLLFSLSATAPAMPSGWNSIQRLQAIKTDGAGAIRPFVTDGKETRLVTPVEEYSGGARSLALLTCAGLPAGVRVQGIFRANLQISGTSDSGITHIVADATNATIQEQLRSYHSSGAKGFTGQLRGYTNTSAQVQFAVTLDGGSAGTNSLTTLGWIDHSIPRI